MKYEFLEHTADIKVRAYGKTLEEAFINSAYALTNIVTKDKIKKVKEQTIEVESEDEKALLYDFLEQFLILIDSEGFLLAEILELKIDGLKLTAKVIGDTDISSYETDTHVKAITYQEMEIKKEKDIYTIQYIPDI